MALDALNFASVFSGIKTLPKEDLLSFIATLQTVDVQHLLFTFLEQSQPHFQQLFATQWSHMHSQVLVIHSQV